MTTIYSGDARLITGGWAKPNPYCEYCDTDKHDEYEEIHNGPGSDYTYVTLRIPNAALPLSLGDRYELTITTQENDQ